VYAVRRLALVGCLLVAALGTGLAVGSAVRGDLERPAAASAPAAPGGDDQVELGHADPRHSTLRTATPQAPSAAFVALVAATLIVLGGVLGSRPSRLHDALRPSPGRHVRRHPAARRGPPHLLST